MKNYLFLIQGFYFLITGTWPLISINSFQLVTGPKRDTWLVKTVGALIVPVGLALIIGGFRNSISPEILVIAIGCAFAFMCVDVIYVTKKVISRIYLLNALAELAFIICMATVFSSQVNRN